MAFATGAVALTVAPVALNNGIPLQCKKITVQADAANTAPVYLGSKNGQSIAVAAGTSRDVEVKNAAAIYCRMGTGTGNISWITT